MKSKIIEARRDGHDTYITKQTKYGTFHGKVTCAAEDYDVENDTDGYIFAETKCNIQVNKERAKRFEQRAIGMRHAYNVLLKSGVSEDDPTLRKLLRQVKIAEREASAAKERYRYSKDNYFNSFIAATLKCRRVRLKKIKTN